LELFYKIYENSPNKTGVYILKNINKDIIYIGKAVDIRKRLASYLKANDDKTISIVKKTVEGNFILANNENEALILEANLIKKYQPKYNILLKDDKSYLYIAINKNKKFPYIELIRKKNEKYICFGPYTSKQNVRNIVNILNKVFLTRKCKDSVFKISKKPCLYYQIKQCLAPCVNYVDSRSYKIIIDDLIKVLHGKTDKIIKDLNNKMKTASNILDYELALNYRDKIKDLNLLKQKQNVIINVSTDIDIVTLKKIKDLYIINIIIIRNGILIGQNNYSYSTMYKQDEVVESFLSSFYVDNFIPKNLYLNFKINNKFFIRLFKNTKQVKNLNKFSKILPLIENNIQYYLESLKIDLNLKLANLLNINNISRIECYDMSNISGSFSVGARVVYIDSIKVKNLYRKYKIKLNANSDDLKMMKEVLYRRFKDEQDTYPDLVLLDGGKTHINAVKTIIKNNIKLLAIAKDASYKDKVYYFDSKKIVKLELDDELIFYLMKIRDEAHRFVNTFHKSKRDKYIKNSILDDVSGLSLEHKIKILKKYPNLIHITYEDEDKILKNLNISKKTLILIKNKILSFN